MINFPSIEQFKNVIKHVKYSSSFRWIDEHGDPVYDFTAELPVLRFEGTVKLHGTNGGIIFNPDGSHYCQSRHRVLSFDSDNNGFAAYVHVSKIHEHLYASIVENCFENKTVSIFGEWCGQGIQKNVAITELPKMFVIFAVRVDSDGDNIRWYKPKHFGFDELKLREKKCYLIDSFPKFDMLIDFNRPDLVQNEIIAITEQVENECPVGKAFGISDTGEGVVWKCLDEGYDNPSLWFKVKGEKHSASKVKTLASVDVEKVNSIIEFAEKVVTENRLNQGIEYLKEMGKPIDIKSTGEFIRWVFNDVMKEEIDTIFASGLDTKDIGKYISEPSKRFWFKFLEKYDV